MLFLNDLIGNPPVWAQRRFLGLVRKLWGTNRPAILFVAAGTGSPFYGFRLRGIFFLPYTVS